MKRKGKKLLTIIAASTVTLFSLFSCVIAAIAWFSLANNSKANGETFKVVANGGGYEVGDIYLHKFNYEETRIGNVTMLEYLTPETGEVKRYEFDNETYHQFGETVQGNWVSVTTMNMYDPIEFIIHSNASLRDLNSNAIYEINLSSDTLTNCYLKVDAFLLSSKTKTSDQIFLTDCVDFDVYTEEELADGAEGNFPNGNEYYPSYYANMHRSLTEEEKIYYKISYLSSLTHQQYSNNNHSHFYGGQSKPDSIEIARNRQTSFKGNDTPKDLKIYVNVNYAVDQLQKYSTSIYQGTILAIFDYALEFSVSEGALS